MASSPLVAAMHDRFPRRSRKRSELLDLDFAGYVLEWHARVPDWRDTYLALDQTVALRVPEDGAAGPDVPAGAAHLGAQVAAARRATARADRHLPGRHLRVHAPRPVAVIQSAITMMAYADRLRRTAIDPEWLVTYWSDRVHRLLSSCVRDRDLVPADRGVDISFHQLNGNEITVLVAVRQGRRRADARVNKRFARYLDDNPRGKHGNIRYDLRGHFGVTPRTCGP